MGVLALAAAATAFAAGGTPGAAGVGDPFFPDAGNGGYNVVRYNIDVDYRPGSHRLIGRTDVIARTTQDLSRFDLDLRGFDVKKILVDGHKATYSRNGQELEVTPW